MAKTVATGISLTFKLPKKAVLYFLLHSLSIANAVENSRGRVCGFKKEGGEEAKKSNNSLRELTPRLKRGSFPPPKYCPVFFHIFVTILEVLLVGGSLFLFMTDKEMLPSSTNAPIYQGCPWRRVMD